MYKKINVLLHIILYSKGQSCYKNGIQLEVPLFACRLTISTRRGVRMGLARAGAYVGPWRGSGCGACSVCRWPQVTCPGPRGVIWHPACTGRHRLPGCVHEDTCAPIPSACSSTSSWIWPSGRWSWYLAEVIQNGETSRCRRIQLRAGHSLDVPM